METSEIIKDKIKNSRLYSLNNSKAIRDMLRIPDEIKLKKLNDILSGCYDSFYIEKNNSKKKMTREEKMASFLTYEKAKSKKLKSIPKEEQKNKYRRIVNIKPQADWLKKTHKKFNKILTSILLTKKVRGVIPESVIPYLHSSVRKRSFCTNAVEHIGDKYVFTIDISDFYPSVTIEKLFCFFKYEFKLDSDIAMIYSLLSTCADENGILRLGQGFSQSATLAYLVNYSLFNYLYEYSKSIGIDMTIYVDDVAFSSGNPIPQEFIDRIFGVVKQNQMKIKNKKVKNYKKDSVKKITGVYIKGNKTRAANMKHQELDCQYRYLLVKIKEIRNFDDYFDVYNLYLKFYGNYQHIMMVEKKIHDRYKNFANKYDTFFPKGINKKDKNFVYSRNNIKEETDVQKLNSAYQRLLYEVKSLAGGN